LPPVNAAPRPSPTQAAHVLQDLDGRIDAVLDGGPTSVGVESTVLDLTGDVPVLLRPGAVTLEALRAAIGDIRQRTGSVADGEAAPSPGLLEKHYSPRAPLTLYAGSADAAIERLIGDAALIRAVDKKTIGILVATEERFRIPSGPGYVVIDVGRRDRLADVAARLYAALRELDAAGVDVILATDFSADDGLGLAIHDRLSRAAAGRIVRR
jgi:L-threonylcarbamoyladenylate synthase